MSILTIFSVSLLFLAPKASWEYIVETTCAGYMHQDNRLTVDIIGYDSGWGSADYGCEDGPSHISYDQLIQKLNAVNIKTRWHAPLGLKHLGNHDDLTDKEQTLPVLMEGLRRLAQRVADSTDSGHIPIVIGGDHAAAMGTWPGIITALDAAGSFGLIWMDAHMDAHTYETSAQGKWGGWWHGQPVAALTGHGLPALTAIAGNDVKIKPEHIVIIGPTSFEPAEAAFVRKHNIRLFTLDEVEQRGFAAVFKEALQIVTKGTNGFGITIDLDGFAPEDAPAVGTREKRGFAAADVLPVLKGLALRKNFRGMEIVEYNPHKDIDGRTGRLILDIVEQGFTKA